VRIGRAGRWGARVRPVRQGARSHVDDYRSGRRGSGDRVVRTARVGRGECICAGPCRIQADSTPTPAAACVNPGDDRDTRW